MKQVYLSSCFILFILFVEETYYLYNQSDQLIYEQENSQSVEYIYVAGKHLARVDKDRVTGKADTYFYHTDHLGSSVLVTNSGGEIVWSAEYTPFGSITMAQGLLEKTVKFTGKDLDEDTGLYYYNARWYDREIGRFISADTYKGELEYPQTLNLYVYVLNNPLVYVDPTGHYSVPIFGDPTGISLLTGLYTNEAWRSNLDNVTNQLYFAVQGVYERWKEGAGSFYFDLYGFELEESILPNKEEFPLDGTVGSQNEEMKYNRPDIPSITDGFEPLPPEFMRPDLPIPLLDRDKSFDVEGISLYDKSIWDYVNLVEGTGKDKRVFNINKQESDVYNSFDKVRGRDRKTSGTGKKQRYYEWDYIHNDIEVYNSKGKHLGSMDPVTGEMYKGPVKGRRIEF